MATKFLKLNDIQAYKRSLSLSNYVWEAVIAWNWLAQKTVGIQFINAIDSISANVAEGFGRFGKKDKIKFYYYSLGSAKEGCDWNEKSKTRKLLTKEQYEYILKELLELPREIHHLIGFTKDKLKE